MLKQLMGEKMNILKNVLLVVAIIVAIPLIAALFVNGEYAVERQIIIDKPNQEVFEYVKFLRNQDNFSKWGTLDPDMKKEYRGVDGTVGFVSAWEGNEDVGKGEQEIVNIIKGERIDFELRFIEPFESTSPAYMTTESVTDNQTRVRWGFSGKMPWPMNLMLLFMDMEDMIGDDLSDGLSSLKAVLEQELE